MLFIDTLVKLLPRFFSRGWFNYTRNYPSCILMRIPLDVICNNIFPYLTVEDIICLRRVNKGFFVVTHEASIWKRFLQRMRHNPAIYIRPSFNINSPHTDYEIEQLVTRTISCDDNWHMRDTKIKKCTLVETFYQVLDMILLPGGKYLLASVKDRASYRYWIVLYVLDHPDGPHAIARLPTLAKAFNLQAKYMDFFDQGGNGIVFSFVRRRFMNGGPLNINPSDYSHQYPIEDVPHPFYTETLAYYVSLDVVEHLADPAIKWGSTEYKLRLMEQPEGPFQLLAHLEIEQGTTIEHISLFDNDNEPWLAIVTNGTSISFIPAHMAEIGTPPIVLDVEPIPNCPIRAILPLPFQKEILVVRALDRVYEQDWIIEVYPFPHESGVYLPRYRTCIAEETPFIMRKVKISDPQMTYMYPGYPTRHKDPLPPISIYVEHSEPSGVYHYTIWPKTRTLPDGTVEYIPRYEFPDEPVLGEDAMETHNKYGLSQVEYICQPNIAHVLPGAYRAMVWASYHFDRTDAPAMLKLRRYQSPELLNELYPEPPPDNSLTFMRKRRYRNATDATCYGTLTLHVSDFKATYSEGVSCMAWDEGIGRVCIAVDRELQIRILDMAVNVEPDERYKEWKADLTSRIIAQNCY